MSNVTYTLTITERERRILNRALRDYCAVSTGSRYTEANQILGYVLSLAPVQLTLTINYSRVVDGGCIGGERKSGTVAFDRLDSIASAEAVLVDRRKHGWTITSAVLYGKSGKVAELSAEGKLVAC